VLFGWTACNPAPRVLSPYNSDVVIADGYHDTPRRGRIHDGIDLEATVGSTVVASADGRVSFRSCDEGYGCSVVVVHTGLPLGPGSMGRPFATKYSHLREVYVTVGAPIQRGQAIGTVGVFSESGPTAHLHWMLCRGSCSAEDTLDPMKLKPTCLSELRPSDTTELVLTFPLRC